MKIDKKNLAVALENEAARQAYLYPEKSSHKRVFQMLLKPLRGSKSLFAMWLVHGIAFGIRPVLSVFVLGGFVRLLHAGAGLSQFLATAGIVALVYLLLSVAVSQTNGRIRAEWMGRRVSLVNQMLSKYMRMDFGLFENAKFQDTIGRWSRALAGNEEGLEGIWNQSLDGFGQFISVLVLGSVLLWFAGVWMLLPLFLYLVVVFFTKANIARYQFRHSEKLMQTQRRSSRYTEMATDFRYGKDTRLYKMEARFERGFRPLIAAYGKLYHAFTGREFHWTFLENAALIAIDLSLFLLLFRRGLPVAQFVPALTAGLLLSQAMQQFTRFVAFYQYHSLYIEDTFAILEADLQSEQGTSTISGTHPVEIKLENVSFTYPGSRTPVLKNCNLLLRAGESCALVGVNGAGKTTLVKLITGMYQPTEGRVLFDGVDARDVPADELFRIYGAVFQDAQPLAITIGEYIAADDLSIDRERVKACLVQAGLWKKIASLEKGVDSPLLKVLHDDGVILSGGENQKLAIARALYREGTRALILDEPTSALDALAEEKIYREFAQLAKGRTTLFISHRLASTRFCNRIAVLSGGGLYRKEPMILSWKKTVFIAPCTKPRPNTINRRKAHEKEAQHKNHHP